MADRIEPSRRSANMRAIRSKGMRPEMAVRRLVHSMDYKWKTVAGTDYWQYEKERLLLNVAAGWKKQLKGE